MIDFLDNIDTSLLLALNSLHCGFFDNFMSVATGRYVWIPFYMAVAFMLFHYHGWRKALVWTAMIAMAVALADQTCATLIRPQVARMRPANELNPISPLVHVVNGYRGGMYGFPSCHGSNSLALVMMVCLVIRRKRVWLLMGSWALLNVYTRIYLGVHYPGDILIGTVIGCISAVIFYSIGCKAVSRLNLPYVDRHSLSFLFPMAMHPNGAIGMTRIRMAICMVPISVLVVTIVTIALLSI